MSDLVTILVALLGGGTVTALITLWVTRRDMQRKLAAEREKLLAEAQAEKSTSESTDVDAFSKFKNLLKELQDRNDELYKKTVVLEKQITERDRSLEVLHDRLADRDSQLEQNTKTLEHLRNLAKDSPVIETLRTQLEAMNVMALSLQAAQTEGQKILLEKEKSMHELLTRTNRDLELKKPAKP
jgi:predicted RNase H-like nuclease (RuvC/YqgF family)